LMLGEHAGARTSIEIALHRRIPAETLSAIAATGARGCHIQDRVHDRSQFRFGVGDRAASRRKQRLDQRPIPHPSNCLRIRTPSRRYFAGISSGICSPRILAHPKESQPAEITQLLFQSASYTIITHRRSSTARRSKKSRRAPSLEMNNSKTSRSRQC